MTQLSCFLGLRQGQGHQMALNLRRWLCGAREESVAVIGAVVNKLSSSSPLQSVVAVETDAAAESSKSSTSTLNAQTALPLAQGVKLDEEGEASVGVGNVENHFEFSKSFQRSESWRTSLLTSMLVYPKFITIEEEDVILKEIEPYLSRLHYEDSHWDDAIHAYRETERSKWNKRNEIIINRIRGLAFPPEVPQLKLVHILDLAKSGVIKPHIDSIRFCGNTIAGLSLLSDCVMRLRHDVQKDFYCDIYLPRLSLYVMRNFSRYEFTHEILGEAESIFKTDKIIRDRRVSIICRNEPSAAANANTSPVFTPLAT